MNFNHGPPVTAYENQNDSKYKKKNIPEFFIAGVPVCNERQSRINSYSTSTFER